VRAFSAQGSIRAVSVPGAVLLFSSFKRSNNHEEVITMAKYIFSQGQVYVDEKIFVPLLKKPKRSTESSVLLILHKRWQFRLPAKEKRNVQFPQQ
jgi:hypothetical protein